MARTRNDEKIIAALVRVNRKLDELQADQIAHLETFDAERRRLYRVVWFDRLTASMSGPMTAWVYGNEAITLLDTFCAGLYMGVQLVYTNMTRPDPRYANGG